MENNWLNLMHLLKKMFMIVKKDHKSDSKEEGLDKIVVEKKSEINDLNEKTVKEKKTTNNKSLTIQGIHLHLLFNFLSNNTTFTIYEQN